MPLKTFQPTQPKDKGASVTVRVSNPPDGPFSSISRRKNPAERLQGGLFFLIALGIGLWAITRLRPSKDIGSLSKQSGIGEVSRFRIERGNADRVRAIIHDFLSEARRDEWFGKAVLSILAGNHIDPRNQSATAAWLHMLVNEQLPTTPDPAGYESITSPVELMRIWAEQGLSGLQKVPADCDDKTILLAAMAFHAGIPAQVCLLDTDGDGEFDHAGVILQVEGREVYAETVVPGVPLGWIPPHKTREVVFVP